MKLKKCFMVSLMLITILFITSLSASAAWYECEIKNVGAGPSILVRLTDTAATPAFTNKYYYLSGANKNQMLATVLTALSMEKNIIINLPSADEYSTITSVFIVND